MKKTGDSKMLKAVKGENVRMLPGLFQGRMKLNEDYLMELKAHSYPGIYFPLCL